MSHVDEGRLHAFLDGALSAADPADAEHVELHLAACADCRARLDEAARVRDDASALLAAAQPRAFVMPSFDAIRARSATVAPAQRVKRSVFRTPFNEVAWAAMVILAVGLGWMLNDTLEDGDRVALSGGGTYSGSAEAESRVTTIDIPISPVAPRAEETEEALLDATDAAPEAFAQTPRPTAGAGATRRAVEYDVEEAEPAPAPVTAADQADGDRAATRQQPMEPQSERVGNAQASSPPAPPPAARASVAAAAPAAAEEALAGSGAAGDASWRSIGIAEAERLTDGKLVRLAGARITSSATRGSGTELEVQTVQVTDRGESIKVVQRRTPLLEARRRETLEAQAAKPEDAGVVAGLTVRVEEWTVTISGAVPPDRLRELAAHLS